MKLLGGIDEAGYGPLLGPLTLGYALFACPEGPDGLRRTLRRACSGEPRAGDRRVAVCDSKVLHRGPRKLARLERTALAFLAAARGGSPPRTVGDVLLTGVTRPEALAEHPWYRDLDVPLPRAASRAEVDDAAGAIASELARTGVRILELGTRVVPERELNRAFEERGNKSLVLFEALIPILAALRNHAGGRPVVVCDKHGSRGSYAPLLARALDGGWVTVAAESRRESLYRVRLPEGALRFAFVRGGESRSFACALASCLAKYARELAMERWNGFFARIAPGVRPTAGYVSDARRFLREAGPALAGADLDPASFVRSR